MKKNFKYLLIAVSGGLLFGSCAKKLDEAYPNPNAGVRQPIEKIFPSMIGSLVGSSSAAGSAYGLAADALLVGRYVQYWGTYAVTAVGGNLGTQYDRMGGTVGASDNLGSVWAAHYYGMGQNLNRIIEWGSEEQKWDFVGAAWALRAWSLFENTNQYGDMILREAFNTSLQTFKYEEQEEVYDSVRATCHRAISFLIRTDGNVNPTNFAASDFYFNGGSIDKWKKFVYGILARSYAYVSNKSTYSADSVIKYANLSCKINVDNITAKFANTGITGTSNYYGNLRQNVNNANTAIRQAAYIADLMTGTNPGAFTGAADPRAFYMLRENLNGTIKGITPWSGMTGLVLAERPRSFVSTGADTLGYPNTDQGRYIFRNNAEFPIMTASEILFIKAEAELRKGLRAASLISYTQGISLHFDMLVEKYSTNVAPGKEITAANKAAYMANTNVIPATDAGMTLTKIMLQKYIALFGWGVHATWADMRRYHYTDLDPSTSQQVYAGFVVPSGTNLYTNNSGKLVYRTRPRYNSEYLYNIPELQRIGALLNDYHTRETWFSKP
ncbi:MAG: SusD/RagB family nutrient-binding outer membrane lipoprotein [Chitinophagaceae bacterium]|nr:SusD/RagB family nutrient-binding outer membrane lipoprotein [Chitinophagaceae bacterium]